MRWEDRTWDAAYAILSNTENQSPELILEAITRLGKPFDRAQILRASPLVATYLEHENFLVRHQAVWFLGCWGRVPAFISSIIRAAQCDVDMDNRAYAANCAGQILKSNRDGSAIKELRQIALSENEEPEVRSAAYAALLYACYGEKGSSRAGGFEARGSKSIADFDLPWLMSLEQWANTIPSGA